MFLSDMNNDVKFEEEHESDHLNCKKFMSVIPKKLVEKEARLFQRFNKSKLNSLKKIQQLYDFMDEIYGYSDPITPCGKGCNYCCYYDITASELEVLHIEKTQTVKRSANVSPPLFGEQPSFSGKSCSFLINGICSIYSSRPFVCRKHIAMTNTSKWCDVKNESDRGFTTVRFSEIEKSYEHIVMQSKLSTQYDIRKWFPLKS